MLVAKHQEGDLHFIKEPNNSKSVFVQAGKSRVELISVTDFSFQIIQALAGFLRLMGTKLLQLGFGK